MKPSPHIRLAVSLGLLAGTFGCAPAISGSAGGIATPAVLSAKELTTELNHLQLPRGKDGTTAAEDRDRPTTEEVAAYLRNVISDLDATWGDFFKRLGLPHRKLTSVLVTPQQGRAVSQCQEPARVIVIRYDTPNAVFCGADQRSPAGAGTIYLPVTTLQKVWEGDIFGKRIPSREAGDHSAAIIVAHEYAHYVTDELRWQFQQRWVTYPNPTGKWNELLADCMAGVWAAHTHITPHDVNESVIALRSIGDYDYNSPDHHGTPEERMNAVLVGFNGIPGRYAPRTPAACVAKYWKTTA
ncbi:neutral zinc metallopeptidase [Streptomyces sp. NPDC001544]|uniref:neutral zinc metallopeptidase n=1 Tax=Streptomyces sp. NPDC001544 TaxID=3364584 RepID=UPI0036B9F841